MANYEADFHFNKNTMDFNCELAKNSIQADLILQYKPDKLSQLYNDVGFITKEVNNLTFYMRASDIRTALNTKVDKVTGKGLSTNDFTNAYKTKLEEIEAGAQVNTVTSVNGQVGDVEIVIPDSASFRNLTGSPYDNANLAFELNSKQPNINDLDTIREGASKGSTALQPNNNISRLYNDVGYITSASLPTKLSDLYNDTGFITNSVNNLTNYYLKSETYTKQEVNQLIANIPKFRIQIVQALPQTGEAMVLYLVPKVSTAPDVYDEYIWITESSTFELIGSTAVDLTGYAKEQWVINQGYITGITSLMVINALGYTPYSSANPNNYTSVVESTVSGWGFTKNTGTVTSVNNVSPVNGNVTLDTSSSFVATFGQTTFTEITTAISEGKTIQLAIPKDGGGYHYLPITRYNSNVIFFGGIIANPYFSIVKLTASNQWTMQADMAQLVVPNDLADFTKTTFYWGE